MHCGVVPLDKTGVHVQYLKLNLYQPANNVPLERRDAGKRDAKSFKPGVPLAHALP